MGYPVVHFEINTASQSDLARFYEEAFGWTTHADGDDYLQINTNGVCAGIGEPGIEGGIGPSDPGDDFVTFYVQVPDVEETLAQVVELGAEVDMPATERSTSWRTRSSTGGRPGLRRGCVHLRVTSSRCQRRSVCGVTIRPRRQYCGRTRVSAAKNARSAGRSKGRRSCRLSTTS
jgi:predicted enzyme related to lactoylglutathione lyase